MLGLKLNHVSKRGHRAPNITRTVSRKAWNTPVKYRSLEYKSDVMESHSDVQSNILKKGLGAEYPGEINKYKTRNTLF